MIAPLKTLGQNFLKSEIVAKKMAESLNISSNEEIIEIGPGFGSLTEYLALEDNYLHLVELDSRLVNILHRKYSQLQNASIINANILEWLPDFYTQKNFKIIGSIPYNITSPLLHIIVSMEKAPLICVLLVQKEVGQKITNNAPNSSYLSTLIQTFYTTNYIETINKKHFEPMPKVDGAIIKLERKTHLEINKDEILKYESFLHKCYSQPRKMLNKRFSISELNKTKINGKKRAQELNFNEWVKAYKILN